MKLIKAYLYGELLPEARVEVEAGALIYASAMLVQGQNCPPHLIEKAHQTFKDEYLGGLFSANGKTRFPAEAFKEVGVPAPAVAVPAESAPVANPSSTPSEDSKVTAFPAPASD